MFTTNVKMIVCCHRRVGEFVIRSSSANTPLEVAGRIVVAAGQRSFSNNPSKSQRLPGSSIDCDVQQLKGKVKFYSTVKGIENMAQVHQDEARRFMEDTLKASGAPPFAAAQQAAVMLEADRQGHYSHGMNRLAMYCNDILTGACFPDATPNILKETAATAWVDGAGALGATVGEFCMDLAIKKAKDAGVGWVAAKHSNHYGIAGWYSMRAMDAGMIGMSFTNTSPLMAPTRSKKAALGTNPLALGACAENGDRFLLDMATTAVAVGKIEIQRRKEEPIPEGWAQGPDGKVTTDANLAFDTGCLMPLGGPETTSGYKGYGLGAMVEILCGVTSGSLYGHHIRSWSHQGVGGEADLGQCFIAMNPECFAPGFKGRMSDLLQHLRSLESTDPANPVIVPGDKASANCKRTDATGIITYHINQIKSCEELAEKLKVPRIKHTLV